jgi:hypothetical protein
LLRMYFLRNREFGLALSKLRNFGGGGLNPPNPPRYATGVSQIHCTYSHLVLLSILILLFCLCCGLFIRSLSFTSIITIYCFYPSRSCQTFGACCAVRSNCHVSKTATVTAVVSLVLYSFIRFGIMFWGNSSNSGKIFRKENFYKYVWCRTWNTV